MAELTGSTNKQGQTAVPQPSINQFLIWGGLFAAGVAMLLLISHWISQLNTFPDTWNFGLRDVLNEFKRWVVVNGNSHWLFIYFFDPLSAVIDFLLRRVEDFLLWLPWPVIVLAIFLAADRIRGLRLALLTAACLIPMGM